MSGQPLPAPGWYPDPQGVTRWWDGYQWTETVYATQQVAPRAPEGVRTGTVWVWLSVFAPLLTVAPTFYYLQYTQTTMLQQLQHVADSAAAGDYQSPIVAPQAMYLTPWYFLLVGAGFVLYLIGALLAYLDVRVLTTRGIARPFHWAWMFLSQWVYIIGRAVVLRRRGSSGWAPLWVFVVLQGAAFIAVMIWMVGFFAALGQFASSVTPPGS